MAARSERQDSVDVPGYVVAERIGEGGFGEVFRARHAVIGREVAVKVLHHRYSADPDAVRRFVAEARAVNQISHPNIVEISDFGVLPDGREYCVMELIHGTTLRDLLRERTPLPLAAALPILRGIAEAVDAAHAAGIAHRDLKPDNVFVLPGGGVKLIDFGLAKLTHEEAAAVTQTGAVFGTPLYMSPEQCRGSRVTVATDAYSFGVLAYHLLVGEPPFDGEALELALHHLNDDPVPPSGRRDELDARVDRVVLALMAKDPAKRPTSLVQAVDAIVGEAALPRVTRKLPRRMVLAVVAAALVGATAVTVLAVRTRGEQPRECALGANKLAGVWDDTVKRELKARFDAVQREDVQAMWKRMSEDLDRYANKWAERWDASCLSDERTANALLWAQRQACLENFLRPIRNLVGEIRDSDPKDISSHRTFDIVPYRLGTDYNVLGGGLDFCTDDNKLRATPRLPSAAVLDRAAALRSELGTVRRTWRDALDARNPATLDPLEARMTAIEDELVSLGVKDVRTDWRAQVLTERMRQDRSWMRDARAEFSETIRRAELAFDDGALDSVYHSLREFEHHANSPASVVEAVIDKAASYGGRLGRDPVIDAAGGRAYLAAREGQFEKAIRMLRLVGPAIPADPDEYPGYAVDDCKWLVKLGRHEDGLKMCRVWLDFLIRKLGKVHNQVADSRNEFADVLAETGRFDEALAEIAECQRIFHLTGENVDLRPRQLDIASRAGRDVDATFDEWKAIAMLAWQRGDLEHATRAHTRMSGLAPDRRAELAELGFQLALAHGDHVRMRRDAIDLRTPSGVEIGEWGGAVADVFAGRTDGATRALASIGRAVSALPRVEQPLAQFYAGILELGANRRVDAVKSLAATKDGLPLTRDVNLAEVDAWLGQALVEAGDNIGAVLPLEESLAILANCCNNSHYFAPLAQFALARALVATNGDVTRAKGLAVSARDGFAKLGGFWLDHKVRVETWLSKR